MEIKVGPLAERAMSSFALSIGTALAFESVFQGKQPAYDPERVIPVHVDICAYDELWVNLATLVRNIHSSVPTNEQAGLMGVDLYMTLESEIEIIRSLVEEGSNGRTHAVFYATNHSKLPGRHPHARMRLDTTDKQKVYTAMRDVVLDEYLLRHQGKTGMQVFEERLSPAVRCRALVLTNDAYDLLSYSRFAELHLLESHTGLLKKRAMWYTKYTQGKELMRIPFNACFMQVFGDSMHFHPWPIRDRLVIKNMADERSWTTLTTRDRLVYCFTEMKDVELGKKLLKMLSE